MKAFLIIIAMLDGPRLATVVDVMSIEDCRAYTSNVRNVNYWDEHSRKMYGDRAHAVLKCSAIRPERQSQYARQLLAD